MIRRFSHLISLVCSALALALSGVALAGCSSTGGTAFLQNLQGCERHYNGIVRAGITGSGFDGSIKVDCLPNQGGPALRPGVTIEAPQTGEPQPTSVTPIS